MLFCNVANANDYESTATVKLLHDPFRKPQHLPETNQNPVAIPKQENLFLTASKLTAILRAGRNSMAIIDGKTLKIGDVIDGYRLIDVKEYSAIFTKNSQLHTLEIDKTDENK
jgi:hypothetical protein